MCELRDSVGHPRPWPGVGRVPVHGDDTGSEGGHGAGLADGALEIESAGREHDQLRCGNLDVVPGGLEGTLAWLAEHLVTPRAINHLGHPMAGGEGRIEPFADDHALPRQAAHQLVHEVDAVVYGLRELLAAPGAAEVPGKRPDRV